MVTLLFVGALLRLLYIFKWHAPQNYFFSDMEQYHQLAQDIVQGKPLTAIHFFQPIGMGYLEAFFLRFQCVGI